MRFALVLGFALPFLTLATTAHAQTPEDEQAHTHFDSGRLYFERGEYEDAFREFDAAYQLSHRAPLLYNIYLSLERLGRTADAADRLEQYLASDVEIDPTERTNLEARLVNLRERAAADAAAAATTTPPPTTAPPPEQGLRGLGVAGVVVLGVGAAALLTFAITGGLALSEDSRLAGTCGRNVGSFCADSDVSTLRTLDTVADAMLATGVVLAAAGAVMLVLDLVLDRGPSQSEHARLVPLVSPTALGLAIGGVL